LEYLTDFCKYNVIGNNGYEKMHGHNKFHQHKKLEVSRQDEIIINIPVCIVYNVIVYLPYATI